MERSESVQRQTVIFEAQHTCSIFHAESVILLRKSLVLDYVCVLAKHCGRTVLSWYQVYDLLKRFLGNQQKPYNNACVQIFSRLRLSRIHCNRLCQDRSKWSKLGTCIGLRHFLGFCKEIIVIFKYILFCSKHFKN